jgi:hypothetical protein
MERYLHSRIGSRLKPGVDVMIPIFCDFRQFSAKKLAFFSKTIVMTKILENPAVVWAKMPFFANFVWRKYYQNHNIGPSYSLFTSYVLLCYITSKNVFFIAKVKLSNWNQFFIAANNNAVLSRFVFNKCRMFGWEISFLYFAYLHR